MSPTIMNYDCIVVGAGICGLSAARKLAEAGKRVLVVEQSNQIGGLCKEGNYKGTRFSMFGPHIFHTDDEEVWQFLSRFTDWTFFNSLYYVKSYCKGKLWSIPIDYDEVSLLDNGFIEEMLYKDYNRKMWGDYAETVGKISLNRLNRFKRLDHRYFTNKYQAFPANGYNQMFLSMTDIKTMSVLTGSVFKMDDYDPAIPIIYTGRIDKLLGRSDLPYMSMKFIGAVDHSFPWSDKWGCINFPQDYDFIRAHSSKILYQQDTKYDVVVYEYPRGSGPECYPLVYEESNKLWGDIYRKLKLKYPNVISAGRAGMFQYMNMDEAVANGLNAANMVLKG